VVGSGHTFPLERGLDLAPPLKTVEPVGLMAATQIGPALRRTVKCEPDG
jgi:hypothetical protein